MNMIYRETLKNGLRIVGETMENYRSVSVGVWIGAGSVFERTPAEAGVFLKLKLDKNKLNGL